MENKEILFRMVKESARQVLYAVEWMEEKAPPTKEEILEMKRKAMQTVALIEKVESNEYLAA